MMKISFIFLFTLTLSILFSQKVEKENLSQKVKLFWDAGNKKLQATGSYYTNEGRGITDEKHGKWLFYSYDGILEEERNYYRNRIHGLQTIYFSNKKIKQQTYFTFNVPDSSFKEWNQDGKLVISGNYDLGSPDGIWEYFYDDGRKKSLEEISNDTVYIRSFFQADSLNTQTIKDGNGFIESFYLNGIKKESYKLMNGLKNGLFEERTANGEVSVVGYFNSGRKEGAWEFFDYFGHLEKKIVYKNDSLDGEYVVYNKDKTVNTFGLYKNGQKTGKWEWNFQNGTPEIKGEFEEDLQNGKWTYFYNSGEISYVANFEKNKKVGEWTYYFKNGAIERKGSYLNNLKNGLWETWYENGTKLMTGNYKNGKDHGDWFNFWENGVLKNKTTFKNGLLHGAWVSYSPENTLVSKGKYIKGLKTNVWIEYFDNGRIKEITKYKIFKQKNNFSDISIVGMKKTVSLPHGKHEAFSQIDFQKKTKGRYKKGVKDGTWYEYHPGGIIPSIISTYKNGVLNGLFQQLGRRGEPKFVINYKNGQKDGWFIVFDGNGKEKIRKLFKQGVEQTKKREGNYFSP